MFRLIYRILSEKIYIAPHRHAEGEMPSYLSLREIADLPPHHPCGDRSVDGKASQK